MRLVPSASVFAREDFAPEIGEPRSRRGIGQRIYSRRIETVDDLLRRS
jgi:hypothetical protein